MSDDNSSSEVNVNVYDNKGYIDEPRTENKKSSETDYYFSHIANHNKTVAVDKKKDLSEEQDNNDSDNRSNHSRDDSVRNSEVNNARSERSETRHNTYSDSRHNTRSESRRDNNSESRRDNLSERQEEHEEPIKVVPLNPQEIRMKKIELLRKLSEIKSKGYSLTKAYDFNSSLEEMEYEYDLLKSFVDKRNGIKIYKNLLLNGASIVEFLNDKYDPFAFHLDGWGEHMSVEVDSYDEVLEEIYEKYKGTGKKMPPELKLLLLVIASGSAFHFTKSHSSIPGLESIINKNPDLISKLLNPPKQKSQFMSEQEVNIERQRAMIQEKERALKAQMRQPSMPQPVPTNVRTQVPTQAQQQQVASPKQEIKIAPNIKEIIERMRQANMNNNVSDTQDESSNNDRVMSDTNVSDSKKRKTKSALPTISVRT
jgi:hypothetical protein